VATSLKSGTPLDNLYNQSWETTVGLRNE